MKKFFKSLAVVLALALVITSVPATAASAASVSLKSKTVTLYSEPSTGKTEDGKVCKSYDFWKIAKLLNNFDAETMDIKLVSEDTDLVQKSNKKDMIWVADGASFGTTKVKVIVTSLSTEKVLLEKSITVKVKKNATEDTFKCDLENGSEFEVGETVAVTLSRKNTDTDARKLTCADDSVEIVDANGYGTKYNVTFTKAGKFTLVASAYQSAKYPAPTVEKEIEVVVTSDFAASATGAREITVVGSGLTKDITVKRNNVTVSADSVVVSEDGTTAVITLASKITDATYVVTFGEQTAEFVGEKQRVEEIVVLDDGNFVTTFEKSANEYHYYVHYDVLDQYGDSVRKNYQVNWTTSTDMDPTPDVTNGVLTVKNTKALTYNSLIVITGTYTGSGVPKAVQAQVNVGLERAVGGIKAIGLYKKTTNELVDILPADFANDTYGFVFACLDQNGYELPCDVSFYSQLTFSSSTPLLATADTPYTFEEVEIDGVMYPCIILAKGVDAGKGGVAKFTAISKNTGIPTDFEVEVDSAQVVTSFEFYPYTDIIADGEKVYLDFCALDKDGNEVTNFNAIERAVSLTNGRFKFRKDNEANADLVYNEDYALVGATEHYTYPDNCVAFLTNGTSANITLDIYEAAKLVAVKSLKDGKNTNVVEDGDFTIKSFGGDWDIVFIDQYDRVQSGWSAPKLTIKETSEKINLTFSGSNGSDYGLIDDSDDTYWFNSGTTVTVKAVTDAAVTSETVSFVLGIMDKDEATGKKIVMSGSEKTCTMKIYDISQCSSFELGGTSKLKVGPQVGNNSDTFDAGSPETTKLGLKGITKDGNKVDIPSVYWSMVTDGTKYTAAADGRYKYVITPVKGDNYKVAPTDANTKDCSFLDYSITNADGSNPLRTQTLIVKAKIVDKYGNDATVVRDETLFDIALAIDTKKDAKIDVAGNNLIVNATSGNITYYDLLVAAVTKITDNYGANSGSLGWWSSYIDFNSQVNADTMIKVDISKISESAEGSTERSISKSGDLQITDISSINTLEGVNKTNAINAAKAVIAISEAEMGDTFVVTFSTADTSVSVNFTVGADNEAWYTNDSISGDSDWF